MKLYVAYGSNLNLEQMETRCPDARIFARGVIENYVLKYRGSKTGAYATIIEEKGKHVPVLVWKISKNDERHLDIYEGFPRFYYKKWVDVTLENGEIIQGMAYIMFDEAKPGIPSDYYARAILSGYLSNNLDTRVLFDSLIDNLKECEV